MNHHPWLTMRPEKDETGVSLRKQSPAMDAHSSHSPLQVSPGIDNHETRGIRVASMDESPQRLALKQRLALDRNQSPLLESNDNDGNATAPMETTNEGITQGGNESNVSDKASMQGRYRNTSHSEAPAYSGARCMHAFELNGNEPRDNTHARLVDNHESTNGGDATVQANNSTALASLRESNQSQVHAVGREVAASPKAKVLHPGMHLKRTAFVDRLVDQWENLPMFQSDDTFSNRTLTRHTTTDEWLQTSTPPPKDTRISDDTLEPALLLQAESTNEKEQTNEASHVPPSKIRKVADEPHVARRTDSDSPGSPDIEEFQKAWILGNDKEPDRSIDTSSNKASTEELPSPRQKQPPRNDRRVYSPNSRQKHGQREISYIPAREHPRGQPSLTVPPHLAANQLLHQRYGSFCVPWSPLPNTRLVAPPTHPPLKSPRQLSPKRQKQPLLYKRRPYQPEYPIVAITADEWGGMIKRLKTFKYWHGHCSVRQNDRVDPELGDWVYKLRQLRSTKMLLQYHNLRPDAVTEASLKVLSDDRIAELVALGFNWYETGGTAG